MPDVDQEQTCLQDRLAPELLTPWCPEFAPKSIRDQEDGGADSRGLFADMKLLGDSADAVRVQTTVEVHGDLHDEDDGEDCPFLEAGEAEAEFVVAIIFSEFDLAVISVAFLLLLLAFLAALFVAPFLILTSIIELAPRGVFGSLSAITRSGPRSIVCVGRSFLAQSQIIASFSDVAALLVEDAAE